VNNEHQAEEAEVTEMVHQEDNKVKEEDMVDTVAIITTEQADSNLQQRSKDQKVNAMN
jgi:hypothetical protein